MLVVDRKWRLWVCWVHSKIKTKERELKRVIFPYKYYKISHEILVLYKKLLFTLKYTRWFDYFWVSNYTNAESRNLAILGYQDFNTFLPFILIIFFVRSMMFYTVKFFLKSLAATWFPFKNEQISASKRYFVLLIALLSR